MIEEDRSRQTILHRPSRFVIETPRSLYEVWNLEEETPCFTEREEPKLIN
jgi:superfamily I DNA/RNA helicase